MPKWTILLGATIFGIGLAVLIQPIFPPYSARARVTFPGPIPFERQLGDWLDAAMQSRRTAEAGPTAAWLSHPGQHLEQLEIVIQSRDREYSLAVVTDLVNRIRDAGGSDVQAPERPARVRFPEPSVPALAIGIGASVLLGRALHNRKDPSGF